MMFDMFPQQNFADWLKSTAFRGTTSAQRQQTLTAIKHLESAPIWQPVLFGQAIEQVQPGAIWSDAQHIIHIDGGPAMLEKIVDVYLEMIGEPVREVL